MFAVKKDNTNQYLFDDAYEKYARGVYLNIQKWVKDEALLEDIFQEVFIALWQCIQQGKDIRAFDSWLYVTSHNLAITAVKRKIKEQAIYAHSYQEILDIYPDEIPDENIQETQYQLLLAAIEKLPKQKKEAFVLYKMEGLSTAEIAQKMGISTSSVKQYVKQAMLLIRRYIHSNQPISSSILSATILSILLQL